MATHLGSPGAGKATVNVRGLDELRAALVAAPAEMRRELPKALRRGARPGQRAAKAAAPRSDADHKHLADSVTIRTNKWGAAVGSPLIQAPVVHFGHVARVSGGKVSAHIRRLTPKPWLIDPVEATKGEIQAETEQAMADLLDRLTGAT